MRSFYRLTTLEQRQCRFSFESNLTHYPVYSRNLCRQECRINLAYKLCKCIPHFYSNLGGLKPVCHYKALKECLFKYADVFDNLNLTTISLSTNDINCYCLPNCRSSEITQQNCLVLLDTFSLTSGNGISFQIRQFPRIRLQRQIIFTLTDLLVSIGGSAGFFLGSSVLSAIEIIYYFTLRLIWHCCGYRE